MNQPRLELDHLAAVIRESMAAHQGENEPIRVAPAVSTENSFPKIKLQPDFEPHADHRYHVNDLLRYHDRAFVHAAYRAVLKRSPSETELLRDLKRLRSGDVNKVDLLATLRFTHEGRAKGVAVEGLVFPALVRRLGQVPLLGYVIRLGIAFVRLPNMVRDQREFGSYVVSQQEQIADFINQASARISECRHEISRLDETLSKQLSTLARQIETQTETLTEKQQTLERQQAEFAGLASAQFSEIDRRYDALDAFTKQRTGELLAQLATDKQDVLAQLDQATAEQQRVLTQATAEQQRVLTQSITEQQSVLTQSISEQRDAIAKAEDHLRAEIARFALQLQHARSELSIQANSINALSHGTRQISSDVSGDTHQLDALYAALEDRFRGRRDEIKERFKIYLPYVKDGGPVVDLGCGRGEWLEILSEAGIEASGVDTNLIQLEQCRARGLNVSDEDFVTRLQRLDDASVGAITGFHIVEHVPLKTLITLLNETLRVLRPGGVAIFETPNPENVLVGSNYFYMDPTHRHPLPSELLEFLLESRGFSAIEILNLHPWESAWIAGEGEVTKRFNDYFYGPMDYAIVGRKTGNS